MRYLQYFLFAIGCCICNGAYAVEYHLNVYPQEVKIGDTCYVTVSITNDTDNVLYFIKPKMSGILGCFSDGLTPYHLTQNGESYEGIVEIIPYDIMGFPNISTLPQKGPDAILYESYAIPPQTTAVAIVMPFQFPPLEDLHSDFWKKRINESMGEKYELKINFHGVSKEPYKIFYTEGKIDKAIENKEKEVDFSTITLKKMITINARKAEEMTLIEKWYKNTPQNFFPHLRDDRLMYPKLKVYNPYLQKIRPQLGIPDNTTKMYGRLPFINQGNRYPGDPNAPETWQGWKELEESLSESTMRDEIRLTRIIIQYCDTKDAKVLEELKSWFTDMNEVQRTCMAKSILERARSASTTNFYAPYRNKIYQTIREYDIAAKSESELQRLKNLKLIE